MQHKHKKHQQQKAEPGSASPSVPSPGLFSPQSAAVAAPYSPVCSPQLRVPTTTPPRAACTAHWAVTTTTINRFPHWHAHIPSPPSIALPLGDGPHSPEPGRASR